MKARTTFILALFIWGSLAGYSREKSLNVYHNPLIPMLTFDNYIDVARNNLVHGSGLRLGSETTIKIGNYDTRIGLLWSCPPKEGFRFSGWSVGTTGNFRINKVSAEVGLFYSRNLFSANITETNLGLILGCKGRHLSVNLGYNYRIYKITVKGVGENGLNADAPKSITEPRNLMYSLTCFILPVDHKWNAAITIANYDHFLIQQETNPMISCKVPFRINSRLSVYTELWYQSAGLLNLQVNYFGYYVRTGLVWNIN